LVNPVNITFQDLHQKICTNTENIISSLNWRLSKYYFCGN
jgi:hypothetical protein